MQAPGTSITTVSYTLFKELWVMDRRPAVAKWYKVTLAVGGGQPAAGVRPRRQAGPRVDANPR
jgi:hypothetical protein